MTPRPFGPVLTFVTFLAVLSSSAYVTIMFDGRYTPESVVEALNFSVQTVTTVGYGNWKPAAVEEHDARVYWVKVISMPTMLAGAVAFGLLVSALFEATKT
ncbi:MAG: ion channel [Candidatus Methylomirabilis sp.]